jgi:hypothetical protein
MLIKLIEHELRINCPIRLMASQMTMENSNPTSLKFGARAADGGTHDKQQTPNR